MSGLLVTSPVEPAEIADALGLHRPTPEQATVIASPVEPSLVVAGAGAGKTETMAARVVWLVANGVVSPERVLGLTFTRKAARQLGERVRARLRRLAGSGLLDRIDPTGGLRAIVVAGEPTVLTYHAYAGRLLSEHGLRLPVQPGVRLLSETSSWQLAHRVVSTWDNDLDTDRVPPTVTAQLLALAGELGEHLVSTDKLAEYTEWLCEVIENAPRSKGQRAPLPIKLQEVLSAQRFRLALLPLVEDYHRRKRAEGALDFADQMSLAAQLADGYPAVVTGERERYGAVLLDEYQDTGHAQRVLLRSLFGGVERPAMPVTAVGDPAQAIYGWRGASAANLPRFTTDFPRRGGEGLAPAHEFGLLTSFRNPPEILELANAISEPLRARGLGVERLRAREGAGPADIEVALLPDVRVEREWVADALARRWHAENEETGTPPSAAVLVRRRADMAPIAAELRMRGLPVEVVGLGGLLDEPEVADLVATLRVLADPLAGSAAARLLTGSRWRIAAADVAALWRRANELSSPVPQTEGGDEPVLVTERAEQAGLIDAVDEPGAPERYSADGYRRIRRVGAELTALRRRLDQSLPELVADVERTMLLDVESLARPGSAGRVHLDAFAEVVTDYAETAPTATLLSFVDYLNTAAHAEDGLTPGEVQVVPDRVQVLTVHSAKGLEWEVVAVPHLVAEVFPGKRRSSSWLRTSTSLPAHLRGDAADLPKLQVSEGFDRKEVQEALELHEEGFAAREADEERRLCYVALTRSERALIVSGHWWNESSARAKGPSVFLTEIADVLREADPPLGVLAEWVDEPAEDEENPLVADSRTASWPVDPLGDRRSGVTTGVSLVLADLAALAEEPEEPEAAGAGVPPGVVAVPEAEPGPGGENRVESGPGGETGVEQGGETSAEPIPAADGDDIPLPPEPEPDDFADDGYFEEDEDPVDPEDPDGWVADTDVLLAERARAQSTVDRVELPAQLSVSQLVDLAADPATLARRIRRPLPLPPNTFARRGTAFHSWLEQRFTGDGLLEIDDLPGAADDGAAPDSEFEDLQEAFERSAWADRVPVAVEVPFSAEVEGITVRGRMDAVYLDPDGGWTVVDWKTGAVPSAERLPALAVQLGAYRLAWAALRKVPVDRVRAAFHYVRHDHTLRPADLLDAEGLRALLRDVPRE
ncbi:ATP-dependent helicase [Amycolatopsis jiangsuensis]|uniref:DNA 3'-5' helicase n=1 Tax=Amycolatopsis jiangsuensis TaxID=1181879 RepID=A0A840IX63_9PSEU|nr:ATP-dependent DNA helicase [Amycolatopsis jiangsuensis]MBB4686015.1 DNA helicase-2/ATP-dependent DNA helicase PcrA [Amycolatopsis jiangsuensis]